MLLQKKRRTVSLYILIVAVLFQGISGLFGGMALVADPSGGLLGMPISWLEGSPFHDYLIPGLILLFVLGVYPFFVLGGLWKGRKWAWPASLLLSIALIIWIGVEILIIGYFPQPPLQLIYGLVGIVMLILVLLPSTRGYFSTDRHLF